MGKIKFKDIDFDFSNSFTPNLTSELFYDAAAKEIKNNCSLLDLGCGCGAVGLALERKFPTLILCMSDISDGAITDATINAKTYHSNSSIIKSNIFENIKNKRFDIIIDDISGISEPVAKISPWFFNAPCDSGISGLNLFEKVLIEAKKFLTDNGLILLPLLSLSNQSKAKEILDRYSLNYEIVASKDWFLPDDMVTNHEETLMKLLDSNDIFFTKKFGKYIAFTKVIKILQKDLK